jgi:hypothetical protein
VFRGQIAEDFKLDTGTFVRVCLVQRRVLANRRTLVDLLYAQPAAEGVLVAERTALCRSRT